MKVKIAKTWKLTWMNEAKKGGVRRKESAHFRSKETAEEMWRDMAERASKSVTFVSIEESEI